MFLFLRRKGKWEYKHVTGIKQEDGTFAVDCKYDCFSGQSMLGWKSWHNFLPESHTAEFYKQRSEHAPVHKISKHFILSGDKGSNTRVGGLLPVVSVTQ